MTRGPLDVLVVGIEPGAAHVFLSGKGDAVLLSSGCAGRLAAVGYAITRRPDPAYTGASVRLYDPVWMTNFRLHNRGATRYRAGQVFLAGDAAHIHSPAGA